MKSLKQQEDCETPPSSEFAQTLEDALEGEAAAATDADAPAAKPMGARRRGEVTVVSGTATVLDETAVGESGSASSGAPDALQWMTLPEADVAVDASTPAESDAEPDVTITAERPVADANALSGVASVTVAPPPTPVADEGPQAMPLQRIVGTPAAQADSEVQIPQPVEGVGPIEIPDELAADATEPEFQLPEVEVVPAEVTPAESPDHPSPQSAPAFETRLDAVLNTIVPDQVDAAPAAGPEASQPAVAPEQSEASFVEDNHPRIVRDVRAAITPDGSGKMEIRLDPPELGALAVKVEMRDGLITASFQTSSDKATRLLSHSLAQLKHSLETAGVTVDRLQVQQAPKQDLANQNFDRDQREQNPQASQDNTRHEQQRREMLQRMWQRLRNNGDPVDLFA